MTARLGDARAVEMIRAHDSVVRRGLSTANGREVKHTGDGIMASFDDALAAAGCARAIQQGFHKFNSVSDEKIRVRIGIDVGEPVQTATTFLAPRFRWLLDCARRRSRKQSWFQAPYMRSSRAAFRWRLCRPVSLKALPTLFRSTVWNGGRRLIDVV